MSALNVCSASVWQGHSWSSTPCCRPAKVEVDGKFYCGIHDPAKTAKRNAIRNAKSRLQSLSWDASDLRKKLADWAVVNLPDDHKLRAELDRISAEKEAAKKALAELEK